MGADFRGALSGDGMQVGEGEVGPLQAVEVEEDDFVFLFDAEAADGEVALGAPFHLAFDVGTELLAEVGEVGCHVLVEALAAHGVEGCGAGVEECLVGMAHEGAHVEVGHEPLQLVAQGVAELLFVAEGFLVVAEDEHRLLAVDLGAESAVEEVEAYDGIVLTADGIARHEGGDVAGDGDGS